MPDTPIFSPSECINLAQPVIKIAIADDHPITLNGIADLINETQGFEVCAEFLNGQQLLNWFNGTNADIILMDMRMPVLDGREASKQLLGRFPDVKIIIFSAYSEPAEIRYVLNIGVRAWLSKNIEPDDLIQSILKVYNGEKIFPESVFINFPEGQAPGNENVPKAVLTNRELEVLQLIAEGKSSQEISAKLLVGLSTIKKHRENIMQKLGVKKLAILIIEARIRGLL